MDPIDFNRAQTRTMWASGATATAEELVRNAVESLPGCVQDRIDATATRPPDAVLQCGPTARNVLAEGEL